MEKKGICSGQKREKKVLKSDNYLCTRIGIAFMNRKIAALLILGGAALAACGGCQSARVSGHDPLLGKTRVDPPTTNARSVYVERQNTSDSGVVPGGSHIQTAQTGGTTQTVRYADPTPGTEETGNTNNAHLKWKNVHDSAEHTGNTEPESGSNVSGISEYNYIYDFSTFPPRTITLSGNENKVRISPEPAVSSDPYTAKTSGINAEMETDAERKMEAETSSIPGNTEDSAPQTRPLISKGFDPYAPNRVYERRREELSRSFASDFSEGFPGRNEMSVNAGRTFEQNSKQNSEQNLNSCSAAANSGGANVTLPGTPHAYAQGTDRKNKGWEVVSSAPSFTDAAVRNVENAPIQPQVGSRISLPDTSATNCAPTPRARQEGILELLELPERE